MSEIHDIVLVGGRVIDPETQLDAVRNVAIDGSSISAVTADALHGHTTYDVSGLVVSPGFIDLHSHTQGIPEARLQALDGVTTILELEAGMSPVALAYARAASEGRPINYGYSASWANIRMSEFGSIPLDASFGTLAAFLGDKVWQRPSSAVELARIIGRLEAEIADGALGIGVLLGYAPTVDIEEYIALARLAATHQVPTYTHARPLVEQDANAPMDGATEIVRAAGETGAHMHYCHVNATSNWHVDRVLGVIESAQTHGSRVTTEGYPYGSGMTPIGVIFLEPEYLHRLGVTPQSIIYAPTQERVADATRLRELRATDPGGLAFVEYYNEDDPANERWLQTAMLYPDTAVASDAMPLHWGDVTPDPMVWPLPPSLITHPRSAGTFARTFRLLVRQFGVMDIATAVRRCSLIPAQIVESAAPQLRKKGRVQVGADADLVVFDTEKISDQATYAVSTRPSTGIRHVLVNGTFVVKDSELVEDALPGMPVRGAG